MSFLTRELPYKKHTIRIDVEDERFTIRILPRIKGTGWYGYLYRRNILFGNLQWPIGSLEKAIIKAKRLIDKVIIPPLTIVEIENFVTKVLEKHHETDDD